MMKHLKPVKRSKTFDQMVETLSKSNQGGSKLFTTIRELMCFAAMLGFAEGKRVPLSNNFGTEDISYQQFEFNNSNDFIYLIAVAEAGNTDVLKSDSDFDLVEVFEEYANGGLEIISGWMHEFSDSFGQRALINGLIQNEYLVIEEGQEVTAEQIKAAIQF